MKHLLMRRAQSEATSGMSYICTLASYRNCAVYGSLSCGEDPRLEIPAFQTSREWRGSSQKVIRVLHWHKRQSAQLPIRKSTNTIRSETTHCGTTI
jgi:hypothetical protein